MATNTTSSTETKIAANNSDGNTSGPYTFSFSYLANAEVEVLIGSADGTTPSTLKTQGTHYTLGTSSITFTSGNFPTAGQRITIQRNTNITAPKVDFQDGSVLTESDLDQNSKQALFGLQEITDKIEGVSGDYWGRIPQVGGDGVMEVGRFIDFHHTEISTADSEPRLHTDGTDSNSLYISGTTANQKIITNIESNKFNGADGTNEGSVGLVPKPAAGDQTKYLKGDGTWGTVSGGSGSTNLTNTANATSLTVESSSGNDTSLPAATTSAWGVMTDEDKTKLDAIEASADVTDATNVNSAGAVMNSDLDGKGEILIGDGSGDPTALAVGTDDYVLTADASEATGVKWAAVSGGGGGISNVVEDTSPQLGGNLDVQANEITTSTTNGNIVLNPNGEHGVVRIKGDSTNSVDGTLELRCSSNSHGVKIKSPPHSAAQTYTLTLPSSIVNGGFLKTDSNGGLSFATPTDTNTTYSAGTGLSLSSTTFNLDTITSVGTIGTGTWQGTAIADSYIASASTWNSKQAALTFGLSSGNTLKSEEALTTNDILLAGTSQIKGRTYAELKTDLSLNNVENTAVSTWAGSSNITTLGTVSTVTSTAVATAGVRKIHAGTSTPSSGTGAVGDIYVKY